MECPNCGQENRAGAHFCVRCGQALPAPPQPPVGTVCPVCGSPVKPEARFCTRCGATLAGAGPAPAAPPARPHAPSPGATQVAGAPPAGTAPHAAAPRAAPPYTPPPAATVAGPSTEGVPPAPPPAVPVADRRAPERRAPERRARPVWLLGVLAALLVGAFACLGVVGFTVLPAFGGTVPAQAPVDTTAPDITIHVNEAYISTMLDDALPQSVDGNAVLDVQPGNLLVVTADFPLLIVRLQVIINSTLSVVDGRIQVQVESIETGGYDILELLGVDQLSLGSDISDAIQQGLEDELGEGARLLTITTNDREVILTARWE